MKKLYFNLHVVVSAILLLAFVACEKTVDDQITDEITIIQQRSVKTGQIDPCEVEQAYLQLFTKDNLDVGHVSIMNDGTNVYVTYFVDEGWFLKETNLFIGKKEDIPLKKKGEPDKKKFPYVDKFDIPLTSYEYVIPIKEGDDCYVVLACAKVNNCEDDTDCDNCDGKATKLTLRYDGDSGAQITVEQKKDQVVVFDDFVDSDGEFTFVGTDKGTLGTEITIKVNGVVNTKIHTSCSQPLYIGLVKGDFTLVDGYSKNGGQFCTGSMPPDDMDDCDDCEGKVTKLSMTYDGSEEALITVKQKKDGVVVFNEMVGSGEEFSFVGTDKGTLGTEIYLSVDGEENTAIHTSCSKPIYIGMSSGDFTITDGYSKNGGQLCTTYTEKSKTKHGHHHDDKKKEEEKCKDKTVWADGGMMFKEYFDTKKWGLLGEYCLEDCNLVIAFKAYMTSDWSITSGGPGNIDFLAYYEFKPDYVGNKIYYNTDHLNSNTDNPVGNITVSDSDGDGLWEVTVDNSDRPDLQFLGGSYLYVGPVEGYDTSFFSYPYIYQINTVRNSITFQLDF